MDPLNAALGEMNLSALSLMREGDSEGDFGRVNVSPIMSSSGIEA
jgi:hypothetical protein